MTEASDQAANAREHPQIEAETWFALALAAFMITLVIICFVAIWVFSAPFSGSMVKRSQAFTPFGAAMLAVVTFCTVAWRGALNSRQLEMQGRQLEIQTKQLDYQVRQLEYQAQQLSHQAEQLSQTRRQNDSNEEANLAKLLQEGAKLLGEKDKEPQVLGGIVSLEILILGKSRFAVQAMDLLADFYGRSFRNKILSQATLASRRALAKGQAAGLSSTVEKDFRAESDDEIWEGARGFYRQNYFGGSISNKGLKNIGSGAHASFDRTMLKNCTIKFSRLYWKCNFVNCKVSIFTDAFVECTFTDCDFSDCTFVVDPAATKSTFVSGNTFLATNPPTFASELASTNWLVAVAELPSWCSGYYLREPAELEIF